MYIFQWIGYSNVLICFLAERYWRNWGSESGSSKMCTGTNRERGLSCLMCTYALHHLFSCFCLMVPCFICRNLTLLSFKKGVFVRNGYFSPMRSTSVVMKITFFTLNCFFFRTKVSQNTFNSNQIDSMF